MHKRETVTTRADKELSRHPLHLLNHEPHPRKTHQSGGSLSRLGQLGRETGMAAEQLRVFQGVAGKFGVSGDASSAAAKTVSQKMTDIRRGVGETMGFLQSQNSVVAQFAVKLKGTASDDEALKLTEVFLEQILNAVDRGAVPRSCSKTRISAGSAITASARSGT